MTEQESVPIEILSPTQRNIHELKEKMLDTLEGTEAINLSLPDIYRFAAIAYLDLTSRATREDSDSPNRNLLRQAASLHQLIADGSEMKLRDLANRNFNL